MEEAKTAIIRMHKIDGRECDEAILDSVLEREQRQFLEASKKQKKYNYVSVKYASAFISNIRITIKIL
jgi:methyltransferase-like protein